MKRDKQSRQCTAIFESIIAIADNAKLIIPISASSIKLLMY